MGRRDTRTSPTKTHDCARKMTKKWHFTLLALVFIGPTAKAQEPDIQGNAAAGAGKVAMCIGCHGIVGYRASFPQVHKVPMISGQSAPYIGAALEAYQKGERKHPAMRGVAEPLSEQDVADIAAFYAAQTPSQPVPETPTRAPSPQVAQLLQKGDCVSCHGANFSQPIDGTSPKIAGQHADYLLVALQAYKNNKGAYVGRSNAVMAGIVAQFSTVELKALAGYMASLEGELQVVPQQRFRR